MYIFSKITLHEVANYHIGSSSIFLFNLAETLIYKCEVLVIEYTFDMGPACRSIHFDQHKVTSCHTKSPPKKHFSQFSLWRLACSR